MISSPNQIKFADVPPGQEEEALEPNTLIIDDELLRSGFTSIPNYILADTSISITARFTYITLLSFAWQQGNCFPGQQRLANILGVHKRTIIRFLQELEDRKYIARERRGLGKTNIYHILKMKLAQTEAEVTAASLQEVTPMSTQKVTPVSHKEYSVEEDPVEKDSDHSKYRKVEKQNGERNEIYSEEIAKVVDGLSKRDLQDPTHIRANVSQAQNLWNDSKVSETEFLRFIREATKRTLARSDAIRKIADGGRGTKNLAPYFFQVLKTLVRETILANFRKEFKSPT